MALPPHEDPLNPTRHPTDPAAADPLVTPNATYNQTNVTPRSGSGNGILIGAVVVVLALVAYFVFVPTGGTPGTDAEPTAATESVTPAPSASEAPAAVDAPAASDAPAPAGNAPAAAPAPADTGAPAGGSTAPAPAQ
jgi:hypothetical protein